MTTITDRFLKSKSIASEIPMKCALALLRTIPLETSIQL